MIQYDIIGDMLINNNINYWVLPTYRNEYNELLEYTKNPDNSEKYIGACNYFEKTDLIKDMDIIILYVKGSSNYKPGFMGVAQINGNVILNEKDNAIKIHANNNLHRYCFQLEAITLIDEPIRLSDLAVDKLMINQFKKYITGVGMFRKYPSSSGRVLIEEIISKIKCVVKPIVGEDDIEEEKEEAIESVESDENSDDSDTEETTNTDNKSADTTDSGEHKLGFIPILIELCDKFKFPIIKYDKSNDDNIDDNGNTPDTNAKCEYFKNHYGDCEMCYC